MRLKFTKMQGLGNDFVVFDAINQQVDLTGEQLRFLADRRFGVGCDQVLLVESPRSETTDFYYRIFNADGSEVEQCGNGARCFARFLRNKGLSGKDAIHVGTLSGDLQLQLQADGSVQVDMGVPRLEPQAIPFIAEQQQAVYDIKVGERILQISAVSLGNPHAVMVVDDVQQAQVETLGPALEQHPRFPQRVNVGFMAVHSPAEIDLRVYERGAGETLACGTGACAAVVAGHRRGLLENEVKVHLPGGDLVVSWKGAKTPVLMRGPAEEVFEGSIEL
ncbi:MAG TPA: diaminopimelate epimerase [Thiolapillus brandeum]|uniref:Diaminopimelate epimerase n=1 Tax=Thiolapillus brandeum TaxID=1076588 RepID=A0A831NS06_9GAMM|nr:diaminopimelate epimerase [Thiolapillus brandeum]